MWVVPCTSTGYGSAITIIQPSQVPFSRGEWVLSEGKSGRSVKQATYLDLVPRLRINGTVPLLLLCNFMYRQGKIYLLLYIYKARQILKKAIVFRNKRLQLGSQ